MFEIDIIPCPSCRATGKRGPEECSTCGGSGKISAPLCRSCARTPSECVCPLPCGRGSAIAGRMQLSPCGRPAAWWIPIAAWRDIGLIFDPVEHVDDALRCDEHRPRVAPSEPIGDAITTIGALRRECEKLGKRHLLGRLGAA